MPKNTTNDLSSPRCLNVVRCQCTGWFIWYILLWLSANSIFKTFYFLPSGWGIPDSHLYRKCICKFLLTNQNFYAVVPIVTNEYSYIEFQGILCLDPFSRTILPKITIAFLSGKFSHAKLTFMADTYLPVNITEYPPNQSFPQACLTTKQFLSISFLRVFTTCSLFW